MKQEDRADKGALSYQAHIDGVVLQSCVFLSIGASSTSTSMRCCYQGRKDEL